MEILFGGDYNPEQWPKEILGLTDSLSDTVITNKTELQPFGVLLLEK